MKKWFGILSIVLIAVFCCPMAALAGNINSAEQGVLDAISGTHEYNGEYYRVTDGYKAKVSDYLNQDNIDLSQSEADNYIAQFYANIPVGITSKYMEKVGDVESGDSETGAGAQTGAAGSGTASPDGQASGTAGSEDAGNGGQDGTAAGDTEESAGSTGVAIGDATAGTGASGTSAVSVPGAAPQKDAQGNIVDNTTGSTQSGELEYTVVPMDGVMYVWDTETLDVHAKAYKDSDVIGTLALGDKVTITGGATTGWAQIDFEGKEGYVSAVYLRTDGYMIQQGVEVEPEEEAVPDTESTQDAEESDEELTAAEPVKDYSNAAPVEKQINLGMIAVVIVVVLLGAAGGVLFYHRAKGSRRK